MSNKILAVLILPFAVIEGVLRYLPQVVPNLSTLWHVLEFVVVALLVVAAIFVFWRGSGATVRPQSTSYWKYFVVLFLYFYCADKLRTAQIDRPKFGVAWLILDIAATAFFMYALISPTFLTKKKK